MPDPNFSLESWLRQSGSSNHGLRRLFQDGAVPAYQLFLRRLLSPFVVVLLYVFLDRATVYLQIWPSISAWYPPVGLAVALMVGVGLEISPAILLAGFLSGYINYHQSPTSLPFLVATPLVPLIYGVASLAIRRRLGSQTRIRSIRDVGYLLGISLVASGTAAFSGTAMLVWNGDIARPDYIQAALNWWIGDAVALSSVTPFLLEFVIPWCRRFLFLPGEHPVASRRSVTPRVALFESFSLLASLVFILYLVYGNSFARSAHLFYLFFLPLIWIAIRRGLRGVVVALLLLDTSLAIMMHFVHQGIHELAVIQFLMLILALTSLLLGAIIGERKEAERRLADEEERIRLILDSTAEGIYGIDLNGIRTFINTAALRILGFASRDEALGRNFHALCHHTAPDGSPMPTENCRILSFRAGRISHVDDEIFWRKDASSFPVEYWSHPIVREGEITGCVVTFLDVTQRRAFERAIRESEQKFRAVFEGADIGIALVDLRRGHMVANPTYQRMLGTSAEEMQSIAIFNELTHPDQLVGDAEGYQRLARGEIDHLHVDKRYLLRDSRVVWASVEFSILRDASGQTPIHPGSCRRHHGTQARRRRTPRQRTSVARLHYRRAGLRGHVRPRYPLPGRQPPLDHRLRFWPRRPDRPSPL